MIKLQISRKIVLQIYFYFKNVSTITNLESLGIKFAKIIQQKVGKEARKFECWQE